MSTEFNADVLLKALDSCHRKLSQTDELAILYLQAKNEYIVQDKVATFLFKKLQKKGLFVKRQWQWKKSQMTSEQRGDDDTDNNKNVDIAILESVKRNGKTFWEPIALIEFKCEYTYWWTKQSNPNPRSFKPERESYVHTDIEKMEKIQREYPQREIQRYFIWIGVQMSGIPQEWYSISSHYRDMNYYTMDISVADNLVKEHFKIYFNNRYFPYYNMKHCIECGNIDGIDLTLYFWLLSNQQPKTFHPKEFGNKW